MKKIKEIAILGMGLSGSLLLSELISNLNEKVSIICFETREVRSNKVISYWSKNKFEFPEIEYKSWDSLSFNFFNSKSTRQISPYKYYSFLAKDFDTYINKLIKNSGHNIKIIKEKVVSVSDLGDSVEIKTPSQSYKAEIAFDGRNNTVELITKVKKENLTLQEFTGWMIKTKEAIFNTNSPTLFDFRSKDENTFSFAYLIPLENNRALIDFVRYTDVLKNDTKVMLQAHIEKALGIKEYTIEFTEAGIIPLITDKNIVHQMYPSTRIIPIGTNSGSIKSSTGYGFTKTLKEVKKIVQELNKDQFNIKIKSKNWFYNFCDKVLLNILKKYPKYSYKIFSKMFRRSNSSHILNFLNEEFSLIDLVKIGIDLPIPIFLKEIFNITLRKK